jgi:hypothetical protein
MLQFAMCINCRVLSVFLCEPLVVDALRIDHPVLVEGHRVLGLEILRRIVDWSCLKASGRTAREE